VAAGATYGCEVVTFTADLGQGEELEPPRARRRCSGVKPENIFIEDVREEFVRDFVFPMFRANAVYEGQSTCSAPRSPGR
jgi:argininosuccinate synthase